MVPSGAEAADVRLHRMLIHPPCVGGVAAQLANGGFQAVAQGPQFFRPAPDSAGHIFVLKHQVDAVARHRPIKSDEAFELCGEVVTKNQSVFVFEPEEGQSCCRPSRINIRTSSARLKLLPWRT